MIMAGFNYYEKSLQLGNGMYAYIVDQDTFASKSSNIVILEVQKKKGAIEWKEWHFGTFKGKPLAERTKEEREDYFAELKKISGPQNKVKGYELAGKLQDVIDQMYGGAE